MMLRCLISRGVAGDAAGALASAFSLWQRNAAVNASTTTVDYSLTTSLPPLVFPARTSRLLRSWP